MKIEITKELLDKISSHKINLEQYFYLKLIKEGHIELQQYYEELKTTHITLNIIQDLFIKGWIKMEEEFVLTEKSNNLFD
jgi:hypothetical protein